MIRLLLLWLSFGFAPLIAGPFAPAANEEGTTAVPLDDPRIVRWASALTSYSPGEDVDEIWQNTENAITPATTNTSLVTTLGRGGEIVLEFVPPIQNGAGADFAVFENSFAHTFLELAFVEVSVDGVSFERFANVSETASAVGPFGFVDPTNIDGLAGKYIGGYGTPFDLSSLPSAPAEIRFVRLIDVTGGSSLDSEGEVIFDPFPTQGSAGFDLTGIAVLERPRLSVTSRLVGGDFELTWEAEIGETYVLEASSDLTPPWETVLERLATGRQESVLLTIDEPSMFYRIHLKNSE